MTFRAKTTKGGIKQARYALTAGDFGYYAMGGGKVWSGSAGREQMTYWIHPKNAFTGTHNEFGSIKGGKQVEFRQLKLKETGGTRGDGSAVLTFNP